MEPARTLTIEDLVKAFLDNGKYKGSNYYEKRLELLKKLFKCDIEKRERELDNEFLRRNRKKGSQQKWDYDVYGNLTVTFFEICISATNLLKNPFHEFSGGLMAGLPPKVVRDLEQKYNDRIEDCRKELEKINRTVVREVLTYMFPGIEKKRVKESVLYEKELHKEVSDELDYF